MHEMIGRNSRSFPLRMNLQARRVRMLATRKDRKSTIRARTAYRGMLRPLRVPSSSTSSAGRKRAFMSLFTRAMKASQFLMIWTALTLPPIKIFFCVWA